MCGLLMVTPAVAGQRGHWGRAVRGAQPAEYFRDFAVVGEMDRVSDGQGNLGNAHGSGSAPC